MLLTLEVLKLLYTVSSGKMILDAELEIFKKKDGEGMDWIDLAQDRDKSWALVSMVTSRFHKIQGTPDQLRNHKLLKTDCALCSDWVSE